MTLYENLIGFVKRKFFYLNGIESLAEDIVQDAYAAMLSNPGYDRKNENFGYLSVICSRIAYRHYQKQKKYLAEPYDILEAMPDAGGDRDRLIEREERLVVLNSLNTLRELERVIIDQRYFGGYTFAQIAEHTGIKLNTVLSGHRRALERLRPTLADYFERNSGTTIHKKEKRTMKSSNIVILPTLAERLRTLSTLIACQCVGSEALHTYAMVAEETRHISNAIFRMLNQSGGINKEAVGLAARLETLCVNTAITANNAGYSGKEMAVLAEELRYCVWDMLDVIEPDKSNSEEVVGVFSPPCEKSTVITRPITLFCGELDGKRFVENVSAISEVLYYNGLLQNISDGKLLLRGKRYPVANAGRPIPKDTADLRCVMVNALWEEGGPAYCLIADYARVGCIIGSPVGISATRKDNGFPARECWNAEDGGQLAFPDYAGMGFN